MFKVDILGGNVGIHLLDLIICGVRYSVGSDYSVCTEIEARPALLKVAAVEPFAVPAYRLIDIIPDKSARHMIVFFKIIDIFLEVAEAVLHAVSIFAVDDRMILKCAFGYILVVRRKSVCDIVKQGCGDRLLINELFNDVFHRVHSADEIGFCEVEIALVMYRIEIAELQYSFFHLGKVCAVPCLISERPEADTGVTSVTEHHHLGSVDNCGGPKRIVAGDILPADAVTFNVALVHNIKSKLVTKLVKERIVGIMACSDSVDISLLHKVEILIIPLPRHSPAVVGIKIVTVNTLDNDLLTVYIIYVSDYFNTLEAYPYLLFHSTAIALV